MDPRPLATGWEAGDERRRGTRGGGGSERQARRGGDPPESPWGDTGDEAAGV